MDSEKRRRYMVDGLRAHGIHENVLDAMGIVPRHFFVPADAEDLAYADTPLGIGFNQTISAPHMVAIMCDILDLRPGMNVLEIGAGSGYHAAVMAQLVGPTGHVHAVERIGGLVRFAKENLVRAGVDNVTVHEYDGTLGLAEFAPYDRISVACAAPDMQEQLMGQLKDGGKMVIPVGKFMQELYLVTKKGNEVVTKKYGSVVFVPLVGKYGFK